MPQASDDLRQTIIDRFGSIDDFGPSDALTAAGYTLNSDWTWTPPTDVRCLKDMTREHFEWLMFLSHEWDYGSLIEPFNR